MRISDRSSDVCSSDLVPGRQQRRALHRVAQLAHVAGPRVAQQRAFGVFGQALAAGQEVPCQRQDVARACAEWRQAQFDTVEAVEQVLAEAAVGNQHRKVGVGRADDARSEEHTSELQSLMRKSYAVFCLKKKKNITKQHKYTNKITENKQKHKT